MEAQTASYTVYKGIKFRLPALQLDAIRNPRKKGHSRECAREARALNASESTLKNRRMKEWLQKRSALLKNNGKKLRNESIERKTSEIEVYQETLRDSFDAMGFLARELTVYPFVLILAPICFMFMINFTRYYLLFWCAIKVFCDT